MPDGDHLMPGGYHLVMLQQAVDMELAASWGEKPGLLQITVDLTASEVGHRVPGGEHFRFLELETTVTDAEGNTVAVEPPEGSDREGPRQLGQLPHVERLQRHLHNKRGMRVQTDDRLRPEQTTTYKYFVQIPQGNDAEALTVHAEVRYHLMSADKARLFGHGLEDVRTVIREATVRPE
jgi:hypothetical protein